MTKKERVAEIMHLLWEEYPEAECQLNYSAPHELLIATRLSAQCTDKRVNMVTPDLFAAYDTPEELANAHPDEIFNYIKSVSFPNNKARYLVGMARQLVEKYGSEVPGTLEELTTLPGVGRKTANVIQAVVFNKSAMAVDTHVFRVSHRIGLVPKSCTTPYSVEKRLIKYIPESLVPRAHHQLILHGRYTCKARNPECSLCGLTDVCKEYARRNKTDKKTAISNI